ncbi:MAG: hypothetical protein ACFE8A_02660 [Candidatus Hodarchaeota archaeon]
MKKKENDENREEVQKVQIINSKQNHTSSYIKDKLKELEFVADELIKFAMWRWEKTPNKKDKILKETEEWLTQRIGHGSIGPATAAAEPLLREKLEELRLLFKKVFYK